MSTLADIEFTSQALMGALADADEMAKSGSLGSDFAELIRHARELAEMLDEHIDGVGDAVDEEARNMAATLTAAVESLEHQMQGNGSMH